MHSRVARPALLSLQFHTLRLRGPGLAPSHQMVLEPPFADVAPAVPAWPDSVDLLAGVRSDRFAPRQEPVVPPLTGAVASTGRGSCARSG